MSRAKTDAPLPIDDAVTSGRLKNGVHYYVRRHPVPPRRAELRLVIHAGAVLEDDDQRGLAHFLEHMAFNGTRRFTKHQILDYLQSIGMRFGPDVNAYTSADETVYRLTIPTDVPGALQRAVEILEEWAHGIALDSAEVVAERGVVLEEWRTHLSVDDRIRVRQDSVLYRGSKYAVRDPIGVEPTIATAQPSQLARFYREWYRPELMTVVAVGDFEPVTIEELIRTHFSRIESTSHARAKPTLTIPDNSEPIVAVIRDVDATVTRVELVYKEPLRVRGTERALRHSLSERMYAHLMGDRLRELSRRPDAPFLWARLSSGDLRKGGSFRQVTLAVADSGIERGVEGSLTELERVEQHGFSANEIARARTVVLRRLESDSAETPSEAAAELADGLVVQALTGETVMSIDREMSLSRAMLREITPREVADAGRGWRRTRNRVVLVTTTEREGVRVPSDTAVLAVFDSVGRRRLEPYVDPARAASLLPELPTPGRIMEQQRYDDLDLTVWTLSNGARVLLMPTAFNPNQVLLHGYSPGGTSLADDSTYISALLAEDMLAVGGLGRLDAGDLSRRLAESDARVAASIDERTEEVSARGSPRDLETMMQLVYLQFTAPRVDSGAIAAWRARTKVRVGRTGEEPQTILGTILTQGHPRARPLTPAMVDSVDIDEALAFYRSRFADASDFTFLIVGTFTLDEVRPMVERYLASLPALWRREEARDVGVRLPTGVVRRSLSLLHEPKAITYVHFNGPCRLTREELHELYVLSSVLRLRLNQRLREDLAGTYGVAVNARVGTRIDPYYELTVEFGSAPERVEELETALFAVVDSLKSLGPTTYELEQVGAMLARARETGIRHNGYWITTLREYDQRGWPLDTQLTSMEWLGERLSVEKVRDAARRSLNTDNYVQVTFLPKRDVPVETGLEP